MVGEEAVGACPNARQRDELELPHLEVGTGNLRADAPDRCRPAIEIAHGHGDRGAVGGEGPGGLLTQTG